VPCSSAAQRITLTTSARLDPRCAYTGGFDITASGVRLDCRGASIAAPGALGAGILVHAAADADVSRTTIRDCVVRGFLNGTRITRDGFRELPAGHEYDHGIRGVAIERGSDNGFRENGPGGSRFVVGGAAFRFWGIGRDGISIDGSRRNLVTRNTLQGNSAGGIFLYTNCGEYVHSTAARSAGSPAATAPTTTSSRPTASLAASTASGSAHVWARARCRWSAATSRTTGPACVPSRSTGRGATPSSPTPSTT